MELGRREERDRLTGDFAAFIRGAWPVVEPAMPLIDNWHIDAIAEHLQAVAESQIRFLMINIGPGYAKSIIASVMFSAWLWTRNPRERIIAATYASGLTIRDSIRTRDLITSPWYQRLFNPAWILSRSQHEGDTDSREYDPSTGGWKMVKENEDWLSNSASGERRALSVGGKATGFRADGQIFDDLLNASDKFSQSARDHARDWAISTMSTRFNDMRRGWRVVIGQRLHEQDPYGAMLETGDYVHLCLPSEFEPARRCTTVIGWSDPRTVEGELLFPELFTAAVIAKAKKDLGSYDYAGQHQQRPAPAEGGLFRRNWWKYYEVAPKLELIVLSVDAAFKATSESDFVAIHVWGFLGPRAYLLDRIHDRMGFAATKAAILGLYSKWRPTATLIEDKANGSAIIEALSQELYGVIAINPEGGKESRAAACSPDAEAGNVLLPTAPWAQEVVEEAAVFPAGGHDDDVDAMTQALNWRRMHGVGTMGLSELLKAAGEKVVTEAQLMDKLMRPKMLKPTTDDSTERCPQCQSVAVARIGAGKRCSSCGFQWSAVKGLAGVPEGVVRK